VDWFLGKDASSAANLKHPKNPYCYPTAFGLLKKAWEMASRFSNVVFIK
jgi:hypothetical protein